LNNQRGLEEKVVLAEKKDFIKIINRWLKKRNKRDLLERKDRLHFSRWINIQFMTYLRAITSSYFQSHLYILNQEKEK
jgi:hypothetical protein